MFGKAKRIFPGLRVVVLGENGVGKSSIVSRFVHNEFTQEYTPTVEDFHQTELKSHGRILPLDIVDMTGDLTFPAMRELAIVAGDAFMLVFNLCSEQSFQQVSATRDLIFQLKDDVANTHDIPIVVVANKVDLNEACPEKNSKMECLVSNDWNHPYVETSAKNNYNIGTVFDELIVCSRIPGVSKQSTWKKRTI